MSRITTIAGAIIKMGKKAVESVAEAPAASTDSLLEKGRKKKPRAGTVKKAAKAAKGAVGKAAAKVGKKAAATKTAAKKALAKPAARAKQESARRAASEARLDDLPQSP